MSSAADYRAWVEVLPEFQQFNQQVQAGVVGGMAGAGAAGAGAAGGALVAGISKFAVPIGLALAGLGIGTAITNQIQLGIDAGLNYLAQSVSAGSDYNESLNAISVAYGDFSKEIDRISESSATGLGLSRVDFNAIATQFSAFAKTIREDNPVGFIDELSTRGADFASVFNIDVAEALRLFQSGLAGETEPLRRYGIDLSAATVSAFAYANGIAEQGKQLTETQRQQAAYGALMEQTNMVAGDFANTSDELANSQRIMAAQFEDAKAELGMQLLPVLQEVMAFVSAELMPVFMEFNEELGPVLKESLEEALPAMLELAQIVLPLIPPAIAAVIDSIQWLIETVDGNIRFINLWAGVLQDVFALLRGDTSVNQFVANFQERLAAWREAVDGRVQDVKNTFNNFSRVIIDTVGSIGSRLYESGRAMIGNFIDGLRSMLKPVDEAADAIMRRVRSFFPSSPAERGPFSGAGWAAVAKSGAAIVDQFQSGFAPIDVPFNIGTPGLTGLGASPAFSLSGAARASSEINMTVRADDPQTVAELVRQQLEARLAVTS